jgi:starch synthase (maltosyl-transferring)
VIKNVVPQIEDGRFAVKCVVGDRFFVEADIFKEGHDLVHAELLYKKKSHSQWERVPMQAVREDRWQGFFTPRENVRYQYTIEAWGEHPQTKTRYDLTLELMVDRKRAEFAAWYEFFPRAQGTFKDCISRLKEIKNMGFDVVYLPPIHPIGITNRKGPDNTLAAAESSPGSPWAVGAVEGGHKAIAPQLGGFEEFGLFMQAALHLGLEVALDLAFQCSPDHPYVKEHPEWFYHRPDGSIQCAENPPKKYEDIYPLNFYGDQWQELWQELKSVVEFWIGKGVKTFRVDNPHTKNLYFWQWLIDEIQQVHPEVIFLSEAFTRPEVMKFLGKAGFTQSYTYFTWRNWKSELREYMEELIHTDTKYYFRGNFFANTPDILSEYLQKGGSPAFKIRAVLAATLSSVYGIYSGFEICENIAAKPDSEEYAASEKYEIKRRDWNAPGTIRDYITAINAIRHSNAALHDYENLEFYETRNDNILAYGKRTDDNANMIVVVVNLDPFNTHDDLLTLPLSKFGIIDGQIYHMHDLLTGTTYNWQGPANYVRLNPFYNPAHIFEVRL